MDREALGRRCSHPQRSHRYLSEKFPSPSAAEHSAVLASAALSMRPEGLLTLFSAGIADPRRKESVEVGTGTAATPYLANSSMCWSDQSRFALE